jgi:hypothetical protein
MSDPGQSPSAVATPAASATPLSSVLVRDVLALVGYAAAAVVIVGSLGPWAKVAQFSAGGMDGDGVITLVSAIVAAVAILIASASRTRPALGSDWIAAAAATVAMFVAVYDSIEIPGTFDLLGNEVGTRTAGWGIWVTLIGSIVLAAVAVAIVIRARWRRAR